MTPRRRILLSAYQCADGQGSVSQIGWEWYTRLSRDCEVTLVTHVRNRPAIEQKGGALPGTEVIYIDTEWFAGKWYRMAQRLFPRSEHAVFLLSSLDFFVFEWAALRQLRPRSSDWDLVHVVTPVSPSAPTRLTGLGLPTIRGPLNGGLQSPPNFPEFMRADSAWIYSIRELGRPLRAALSPSAAPGLVLAANPATENQLTDTERRRVVRMQEIAVDPHLYPATPWPGPPSARNPLRVLFVGRLIPAKALPLLLDAIRRLRAQFPIQLDVIGDGPMRGEWESAASDLGAAVRFYGSCHPRQIARHLSNSHLLCLPSVRESGGAVLMEAMSAARPVLAVDYGGPAEIVTSRVGRLVPANGPEAVIEGLAAALADVFRHPAQWEALGRAGRRHAEQQHTWDKRIKDGLALYDMMINSRSCFRRAA